MAAPTPLFFFHLQIVKFLINSPSSYYWQKLTIRDKVLGYRLQFPQVKVDVL